VDSLTHALIAAIIFTVPGAQWLVPYAVLGSVIPDVDIILMGFPKKHPRLYVFTHGGFTHSIFGAALTAIIALIIASIIYATYGGPVEFVLGLYTILAVLTGAMLHLGCDYLAFPGIPLFYPFSDIKYTLGITGGPSIYLTVASLVYIALLVLGKASIEAPWIYAGFILAILGICAVLKIAARARTDGITMPMGNPLKWMVIKKGSDKVSLSVLKLGGNMSEIFSCDMFRGISPEGSRKYDRIPEVRRLRYNSYVTTVEQDGNDITYLDPLRENRYIWYPPYFSMLKVRDGAVIEEGAGHGMLPGRDK
jgi:inner membrane protein